MSRTEREDLNFFHVVIIFSVLGQDLTHLAPKENAHGKFFCQEGKKLLSHLFSYGSDISCHLTWLKYDPIKSS